MKNLFVPYEIAKVLKENGYNDPTLACYDKLNMLSTYSDNLFKPKNYNNSGYCCSAPTYQQVVDWFREVHNIHIVVISNNDINSTFCYEIKRWSMISIKSQPISSYYQAFDEVILKAIEIIK